MAEAPLPVPPRKIPESLKGLGRLVHIAGSGNEGTKIYVKHPSKEYSMDGKPIEEFQIYGNRSTKDTGIESGKLHSLTFLARDKKNKDPYYQTTLTKTPDDGGEFVWKTVGAVNFIDKNGKKITIPRNELTLRKPKPGDDKKPQVFGLSRDAALTEDYGEDIETPVRPLPESEKAPSSALNELIQQATAPAEPPPSKDNVGSGEPNPAFVESHAVAEPAAVSSTSPDTNPPSPGPGINPDTTPKPLPRQVLVGGYDANEAAARDLALSWMEETPHTPGLLQSMIASSRAEKAQGGNTWEQTKAEIAGIRKWWEKVKQDGVGNRIKEGFSRLGRNTFKHNIFKEYYESEYAKNATVLIDSAGTHLADDVINDALAQARQELLNMSRKDKAGEKLRSPILGTERAVFRRANEIVQEKRNAGQITEVQAQKRADEAVATRFVEESGSMIHTVAGEKLHILDSTNPTEVQIANDIKGFIRKYVGAEEGYKTREELQQKFTEYLRHGLPANASADLRTIAESDYFFSTLTDAADAFKSNLAGFEHNVALQRLDDHLASSFQIRFGIAKVGARGSQEKTIVEKLRTSLYLNEATTGTAVALALCTLGRTGLFLKSSAANAVLPIYGGSIAAGVTRGITEKFRLTAERRHHIREREMGMTFENSGRRKLFEDTMAPIKSASVLMEELNHEPNFSTPDELRNAISQISGVKARIAISDNPDVPDKLISYSSAAEIDPERTALDITLKKAEQQLKAFCADPANKTLVDAVTANSPVDTFMNTTSQLTTDRYLEEIKTVETAFNKAALRRSLRVGATTAGVTLGIGSAVRGLGEAATRHAEALHPSTEGEFISNNHTIQLPEGMKIDAHGNLDLVDPANPAHILHDNVVPDFKDHITLDTHGTLVMDSYIHDQAAAHGIQFGAPSVDELHNALSGATHSMVINHETVTVPQELGLVNNADGTHDLVLHFHAVDGVTPQDQIIAHEVSLDAHGGVVDPNFAQEINANTLLHLNENAGLTTVAQTTGDIPHLAGIVDAAGTAHVGNFDIPAGTHLVQISENHYNLVADAPTGATGQTLLTDLHIGNEGKLLNMQDINREIADFNAHNTTMHFTDITNPLHETVKSGETVTDSFRDIHFLNQHDMATPPASPASSEVFGISEKPGGMWQFFEQTNTTTTQGTNAVKHALRSWMHFYGENGKGTTPDGQPVLSFDNIKGMDITRSVTLHDTVLGQEVWWNALPNNAHIRVTNLLFSDENIAQMNQMTNETIANYAHSFGIAATGHDAIMDGLHNYFAIHGVDRSAIEQSFGDDKVGWILFKMGYIGQEADLPSKADLGILEQALNGGGETTQNIFGIHLTENLIEHHIDVGAAGNILSTAYSAIVEHPGIDIPYIPVITPRAPLERGRTRWREFNSVYSSISSLGGEMSEDQKKIFDIRRSPTLLKNPNALLNDYDEVERYLHTLDSPDAGGIHGVEYKTAVEKLASELGSMDGSTKLSILIPVAGHQEGGQIYESLKNYTYQTADKKDYEIVLFVNHPEFDKAGKPIHPDTTLTEIARFKKDYPNMPVKVIYRVLPANQANIGTIRKFLSDVTLVRHHTRGKDMQPLIMVSNDADNKGIAPEYIQNFIKRFENGKTVDGMLGQLDWDPASYIEYPLIHLGTRLFQYLGMYGMTRSGGMPSSGANFAYRSNIFAAVGGYIEGAPGGEDINLGRAIVTARGSKRAVQFAGPIVSRLYTSSRRAIKALEQGLSPVEQWTTGFSPFDDEIRRMELGKTKHVNYDNPAERQKFITDLEYIINRTVDEYERGEHLGKDAYMYKHVLGRLGIKYEVQDNKIKITDSNVLIDGLKKYQQYGIVLQEVKSGKRPIKDLEQFSSLFSIQENEAIKDQFSRFDREQISVLPRTEPQINLEELKASKDIVEKDNYVICHDKKIGTNVYAGYNKETGEMLCFKEIDPAEQLINLNQNKFPDTIHDPEEYLKTHTHSRFLNTYKDKYEQNGRIIKVYPLGGMDLDAYLNSRGALSPKQALAVTIDVVRGLQAMHDIGMVHLDLSPTNILLGQPPTIIDFIDASIKNATTGQFFRGSPRGFRWIKPPEFFSENAIASPSCDTYETAILLYKMVTGTYPYNPPPGTQDEFTRSLLALHKAGEFQIPEGIPESVHAILKKGIQPNPANRYQNATDMLSDLLNAYESISSSIPAPTPIVTTEPIITPKPTPSPAPAPVPAPVPATPESDLVIDLTVPDYMKEFDPKLEQQERFTELEKMMQLSGVRTDEDKAAWLIHHNKTAAIQTFIRHEREQLHLKGNDEWKKPGWETKWLTNNEMLDIADRYNLPVAFMIRHSHAFVLTKPPEKTGDSYRITYYDPFKDGEQTLTIPTTRSLNLDNQIYVSSTASPGGERPPSGNIDAVAQVLRATNYDLTIPAMPPDKEWLVRAKTAMTQEEGYNCTLWSIFHAAVAEAMQPGDNPFKNYGYEKFAEDTGLRLITYEDVVGKPPEIKFGDEAAAGGKPPTPETAPKTQTLYELLDANAGSVTVTKDEVPHYLGGLIKILAPALGERAEDLSVSCTPFGNSWMLYAGNNRGKFISLDLLPDPDNGFKPRFKSKGLGPNGLLLKAANAGLILSELNKQLAKSRIYKINLQSDGTIVFTGTKK